MLPLSLTIWHTLGILFDNLVPGESVAVRHIFEVLLSMDFLLLVFVLSYSTLGLRWSVILSVSVVLHILCVWRVSLLLLSLTTLVGGVLSHPHP